jgi:hypothetical protein
MIFIAKGRTVNTSQDIEDSSQNKEKKSMDISALTTVIIVLAAWIVLSRWVLPWFGVPTCMSGSCSLGPPPTVSQQAEPDRETPRPNTIE